MPQKSLTTCIDATGVYYRVPIACINDPVNYDKNYQLQRMMQKQAPAKSQIKVSFRTVSLTSPNFLLLLRIQNVKIGFMSDPSMAITTDFDNDIKMGELKQLFIDKLKADLDKGHDLEAQRLRFLCLGKELKDDMMAYQYDLTDELKI